MKKTQSRQPTRKEKAVIDFFTATDEQLERMTYEDIYVKETRKSLIQGLKDFKLDH